MESDRSLLADDDGGLGRAHLQEQQASVALTHGCRIEATMDGLQSGVVDAELFVGRAENDGQIHVVRQPFFHGGQTH